MARITLGFRFCWYNQSQQGPVPAPALAEDESSSASEAPSPAPSPEAGRGQISSTAVLRRPLFCWPVALPAVRAWLEPWLMLWRYWRAWSEQPPPPPLGALLEWLWRGRGINLNASYVSP
jgi:hypothetical protein